MQNQDPKFAFDEERAASYDGRFAKVAPIRDALHLLSRFILSELPTEARILCVGAGTGTEIIYLADAFPTWHFTAVDPSAPMLAVCRRRAEERGITARCTFHEGYLDSLPATDPFDAATAVLVSQFVLDPEERRAFFTQIASRLRPAGVLISADLASDLTSSSSEDLFEIWVRMLMHCDMAPEDVEKYRDSLARAVAVRPPREVESIIATSGFDQPVLFLQTLLIHAWFAKRRSVD